MAGMHANRTHQGRSARPTTALKAAGATRPHPLPFKTYLLYLNYTHFTKIKLKEIIIVFLIFLCRLFFL